MSDPTEPDEWFAAAAALKASGYPYPKWKRGPSTEAQRAAMKEAMSNINTALFVIGDHLADEQFGTLAEDGVYADPHRELVALKEARSMIEQAITTFEATDWCLEPASKPDAS